MHENYYKIDNSKSFTATEARDAKNYWANLKPYKQRPAKWSEALAIEFAALQPKSIFEFGCNTGKNLIAARNKIGPTCSYLGIDINEASIKAAKIAGLNAAVGDENILSLFPQNHFDICFTVSVLDHIPDPLPALIQLSRISKFLYLLEPTLETEGKVVENYNVQVEKIIKTTPYSYSWNYPGLIKKYLPERNLVIKKIKMESNLGRYFKLFCLS